MPLTDLFIRKVKPSGKPSGDKYSDGRSLYLLVKESNKYWRMNYRYEGKFKTLAFGNRTAHLPARRAMMQRWADYLDQLRAGAEVIPIRPVPGGGLG